MAKYDFLVVGSSTIDVFARTGHIERVDIAGHEGRMAEHLVCIAFGSKTDLEGLDIFPGGSAANSAVAMQRLGSETALLSSVGNDYLGSMVMKDLEANKVDSSHVVTDKALRTGVGLNITSLSGEKSVLVYRGANDSLGPQHLTEDLVKGSKRVFVTSLVSGKNFSLFLKLVRLAKHHHRPIIFAPSISMLRRWLPKLLKIHASFAVSIFNYEEGSYYVGKEKVKDILRHLPGNVDVVSKDVDGAYAKKGSDFFHVKSLPVKIVDACGAGDAFSGAFAHYYCSPNRQSVADALAKAVGIAAMKMTQCGPRFSSSAGAATAFIKRNRSKLGIKGI